MKPTSGFRGKHAYHLSKERYSLIEEANLIEAMVGGLDKRLNLYLNVQVARHIYRQAPKRSNSEA